jgi:hypothetical protein
MGIVSQQPWKLPNQTSLAMVAWAAPTSGRSAVRPVGERAAVKHG